MSNNRPFAELAVVAGYGDSAESASAVQPSERFHPQLVEYDGDSMESERRTSLFIKMASRLLAPISLSISTKPVVLMTLKALSRP